MLLAEGGGALCGAASPPLLDPHSGSEASLSVNLHSATCSAEQLLLTATSLNAATQLAGLQAVMQRDARLAAAHASVELVLPDADSSGVGVGGGGGGGGAGRAARWQPASPLLQVWWRGEVQLGVSVQLRTARLLLAMGSGVLDSELGGIAGGSLGAAALVESAQAQLDHLARDVFSRPLPAGSTRGMQAASLAAGVIADLLLSLAMRQRLEMVASAGAAAGLARSSLPRALLQQHLRGMAAPGAVPSLGEASLLLSLPLFPAPRDMQRQAARAAAAAGDSGAPPSCGAVACHLLVDLGGGGSSSSVAAAGAGGEGAGHQPRVALIVCATTSRGIATRVLSAVEVPGSVLAGRRDQQQQHQEQGAQQLERRGGKVSAARKRSRKDFVAVQAANGLAEEQQRTQQGQQGVAAVGGAAGEALDMAAVAAWAHWQGAWEVVLAQCAMLKLPFAEELQLGGGALGCGCPAPAAAAWSVRLAVQNGLLKLEEWAATHAEVDAHGRPEVALCLEVGAGAAVGDDTRPGGWRMEVHSSHLRSLPVLCERAGAAVAPLPAHVVPAEGGVVLRYDLCQGELEGCTIVRGPR